MSRSESTLPASPPPPTDAPLRVDETGVELKRGAILNTIALLTSNLRGIFTLLVARLLGPAILGTFSVAWANLDFISKIAVFGLDNAITTFIARSEARGDRARSRMLFHIAIVVALVQSVFIGAAVIVAIRLFGDKLHVPREMLSALAFLLCALPGIALYRVGTSVSWGMKVMQHDIFSRGMTEPITTTIAFLIAFGLGIKGLAPVAAAVIGISASGVVALFLATTLFRNAPPARTMSLRETGELLAYAAPIGAHQMLNSFIYRLDVIMLGFFIGRVPGVTLATVGIYGAALDLASTLRKINQAYSPIFTPVVASMTATGDHERAAATYARLAQWMLWILLPLVAVLMLAGSTILMIYGPAFSQGAAWLGILSLACALNAFVALGESAIMVQRPRLNLLHSCIICGVAGGANLWLIPRYGVLGAAFGLLLAYVIQGILRFATLRIVFKWHHPWSSVAPPIVTAILALVPALVCRALIRGVAGEISSSVVFLVAYFIGWRYHRARNQPRVDAIPMSSI